MFILHVHVHSESDYCPAREWRRPLYWEFCSPRLENVDPGCREFAEANAVDVEGIEDEGVIVSLCETMFGLGRGEPRAESIVGDLCRGWNIVRDER